MKIQYVPLVLLALSLPMQGQRLGQHPIAPHPVSTHTLIDKAMKKNQLSDLLAGYQKLWKETEYRDPEAQTNAYQTLHELQRLPWLTEADRLALQLFTLRYYEAHRWRYRLHREEIGLKHPDAIDPEQWSKRDYQTFYTTLIRQLIRRPEALSAPMKSYAAAFDLAGGVAQTRTLGAELLLHFPDEEAPLSLHQEVLNVLRPSAEGGMNTHYRALIDRQQLQLQRERLSDEERIQALEGYVEKYATEPAIGDELSSFLDLYPYQHLRRARFLESILQRAVALGAKERKELQAEVKRCLRPELAADVDRTFLDRVTVRLGASYLVKQVTARLYKVPTLIRPDQRKEWTPGRTAQPIETKILTLVADSLGEGKGVAPFTMRLPEVGNYALSLQVECAPEASEQDLDALHHLLRTDYVYLEHAAGGVTSHQWLDARTGAPVASQPFTSYEAATYSLAFDPKGEVRSDALGRYLLRKGSWKYMLSSGKDPLIAEGYHYGDRSLSIHALDPLSLAAYEGYITTDRPAYRPGQTAHIYGVYSEVRMHAEDTRAADRLSLRLKLYDASEQVVVEQVVKTDALGRFTTSITLPKEGLTGEYTLEAEPTEAHYTIESEACSCDFSVFEYKREGTELTVDLPQPPYAYGGTLPVSGTVRTLSGSPVSGARVRYLLHRSSFLWSLMTQARLFGEREPLEDVEAEVTTDEAGRYAFTLPLPTSPDQLLHRAGQSLAPWYVYTLIVTSTDGAGESHEEQRTIPLGLPVGAVKVDFPQLMERKSAHLPLRFTSETHDKDTEQPAIRYRITQGKQTLIEGTTQPDEEVELAPQLAALPSGRYQLEYTVPYRDSLSYGGEMAFYLFDAAHDKTLTDLRAPLLLSAGDGTYGSGTKPVVYYATSLLDAYIYYHVYSQRGEIASGVLRPKAGALNTLPISLAQEPTEPEEITVLLYTVRDGHLLREKVQLQRTQPEKKLRLTWDRFRDRLRAGERETWSFTLRDAQGRPADSTAVAVWMYDAALEAFGKWSPWTPSLRLMDSDFADLLGDYGVFIDRRSQGHYPDAAWWKAWQGDKLHRGFRSPLITTPAPEDEEDSSSDEMMEDGIGSIPICEGVPMMLTSAPSANSLHRKSKGASQGADASPVNLRKDFSETTFFLPELKTDSKGQVSWSFNAPEQLSRWRLVLNAHSRTLDHHIERRTVVTSRAFSIRPTLPRFLREGDAPTLLTEVRNETSEPQRGTLTLELFDPTNGAVRSTQQTPFDIAASSVATLSLPMEGYRGLDSVGVRIIARGSDFSDGEQHLLPVLSDRETITETVAFEMHTAGTKRISLAPLFPSGGKFPGTGLFTVALQPEASRLALTALPVLGYTKDASAFATTTALFAEAVGRQLAQSEGLRQWAQGKLHATDTAQTSPREGDVPGHNHQLTETPWAKYLEAQEAQERTLARFLLRGNESATSDQLLHRLRDLQTPDGLWAWYPGMKGSLYTTEYVLRTLLRLSSYASLEPALRLRLESLIRQGMKALNRQAVLDYKALQKAKRSGKTVYVHTDADYLYLVALAKRQGLYEASEEEGRAVAHFFAQLRKKYTELPLDDKPRAALIFHLAGEKKLAEALTKELCVTLVEDETGLFFARLQAESYWWMNRALPATVEMIELLSASAPHYNETIQGLKRWIVSQKRTQAWGADLLTAEAVYGLTLGESLASEPLQKRQVQLELPVLGGEAIRLGGEVMQAKMHFSPTQQPDTTLQLTQSAPVLLWGSATATYTQPTAQVEARGKQIQLTRETFLLRRGSDGDELLPLIEGQELRVGDLLRTRLTLRLEQAMDFIQVSDPRPGFAEPIKQQPFYAWGAGTGYYVEPKDGVTNFYIDALNRGTYLLSYDQYVARAGRFVGTVARVVSCYAPDYSAHTAAGHVTHVLPLKR